MEKVEGLLDVALADTSMFADLHAFMDIAERRGIASLAHHHLSQMHAVIQENISIRLLLLRKQVTRMRINISVISKGPCKGSILLHSPRLLVK